MFPILGMDLARAREERGCVLAERPPAGKSSIRMSACTDRWCDKPARWLLEF